MTPAERLVAAAGRLDSLARRSLDIPCVVAGPLAELLCDEADWASGKDPDYTTTLLVALADAILGGDS